MTDLGIPMHPITHGSRPDLYLRSRGIRLQRFPNDLRMDNNQNMVAIIRDKDGTAVSYQRTFLTPKADGSFSKVRMMKKGVSIPHGASIRLYDSAPIMGVAEGTETALACTMLFKVRTQALISASNMERWQPPEGVSRLMIFADDDSNMIGEIAARNLANECGARGIDARVRLPLLYDNDLYHKWGDWNDYLMERKQCASQEPKLDQGYSL